MVLDAYETMEAANRARVAAVRALPANAQATLAGESGSPPTSPGAPA